MSSEGERRSSNRKLAETLASAGIYVFPSADKVPLVLQWQRADTAVGTDGAEEARAEARAKAQAAGKEFDENTYVGATIDIPTIKRLWRQHKDAIPSISLGPSGLFVADCDVDLKRNGPKLFRQWCAEHGIDITKCPVTRSQSGGEHIFFAGEGLRSHVGPTLDALYVQAKGIGGQVIAPGAWREDGKRYLPMPDHPPLASTFAAGDLPPIPAPLLKLQAERSTSNVEDADLGPIMEQMRGELPEIDFDPNKLARDAGDASKSRWSLALDLARRHGENFTPVLYAAAIQAFEPAGELVDGRPSKGEYDFRQLAREFTKAKAEVVASEKRRALAFGDLSDTIAAAVLAVEAARDRNEDPGAEIERLKAALDTDDDATADDASAVFDLDTAYILDMDMSAPIARLKGGKSSPAEKMNDEPEHYVEAKRKAAEKRKPLVTLDCDAAGAWTPIEWLVDGLIPRQSLGIAFGPPDSHKSFALIHVASHIARGRECLGRRVEQAGVVYWFGEGRQGIAGRFKAWRLSHDASGGAVGLADTPLNFGSSEAAEKTLRAIASQYQASAGQRCELIIIDTLSKATLGLNENDNAEVALALRNAELACKMLDLTVLFVAHVGKDGSGRGVRGASAFEGNVDFRLEFKGGAVHVERMKDARKIAPIAFRVGEVEIGRNKRDESVTSLIVTGFGPSDGSAFGAVEEEEGDPVAEFTARRARLTPEQVVTLAAAEKVLAAADGTAIGAKAIVDEAQRTKRDLPANTIRKHLNGRLTRDGWIVSSKDRATGSALYRLPETA